MALKKCFLIFSRFMAKLLYVCFLSLQPKERQVNGCLHVLCLVKNKFIVKIEGHP